MLVSLAALACLLAGPATAGSITDAFRPEDGYCDGDCGHRHRYKFPHWQFGVDYNKKAISVVNEGRIEEALELFRAAALHSPHRGDVWANVGLALHDYVQQVLAGKEHLRGKALLQEAIAALDLAALLRNSRGASIRANIERYFRETYPGSCLGPDCELYKREQRAIRMLDAGQHIEAVNMLCANEDSIRVTLTPQEKEQGYYSPHTARRLFIIFRVCGVVSVAEAFPQEVIQRVKAQQHADFSNFFDGQNIFKDEDVDVASRSDKRWETRFPSKSPYTDADFCASRFVLAFVKMVLSERIEIDTFSHVTSLPGAPHQPWHADVGFIFGRMIVDEKEHIPAHGVVVVAPLVDLTETTGPTEFMAGSHVNLGVDFWVSKDNEAVTPHLKPEARVGDVVAFDLRIRHRGTPNKSDAPRPIVYMSYVHEWFKDKVNFKEHQTSAFDKLAPNLRKLFSRIDSRMYIKTLEKIAAEAGADVDALRSKGEYKQVELIA